MIDLSTLATFVAVVLGLFLIPGAFRRVLQRHRAIGRWQGKAVGTLYIALGARLALQER